jgi:hypothetical protein
MISAWGDLAIALRVTSFTIPALTLRRSSRLIPGLRASPDVMMTMSDPAVASYPLDPVTLLSYP